ncbi:NUDIX domain-containing protein [Brevibacillus choshinensis]|uniref:NUDIX domain-containing protein n=1 Tax=Brevibacillus choshinensis TaxID=54911 RepID=A0ABX7FRQ0_BRECH|nr:NUDIX domain-containing protein [Brevibacillus choshinensis]QRG68408.1 NUDIX domain-containing protein [Brevibacillus choshinensis]
MAWYHSLQRWYWKIRKPITLGVRVIVTDEQKGVLLIRHTYVNGWYLPGGGVEKGESFFDAARREVQEECGLLGGQIRLCHLFYSEREGKRDHIALFHVTDGRMDEKWSRNDGEVAEKMFFQWDQLPEDLSPATHRRLEEFRERTFLDDRW